jgi:anthranilate phosphoribosyltransferase
MNLGAVLEQIIRRKELTPEQAEELMSLLVTGEATHAQAGGILIALRSKGCTAREMAAFGKVLRAHVVKLPHSYDDLVDIVGTGGGSPSFNISTGSSLVAAAAGARVAKHGNRAVTSHCGAADVLEALGVNLYAEPAHLRHVLDTCGIVFMLAPSHHPALRHISAPRRELGVRTVFNVLGPLVNPAGAVRQLLGVYDQELSLPTAEALMELGSKRALIVHSDDGLDEISPVAPTHYVKVWDGAIEEGYFRPEDFGLKDVPSNVAAPEKTVDGNAAILREALSRPDSPRSQALIPSAATALWLAGVAEDLAAGADLARNAIASGAAIAKLHALAEASQVP